MSSEHWALTKTPQYRKIYKKRRQGSYTQCDERALSPKFFTSWHTNNSQRNVCSSKCLYSLDDGLFSAYLIWLGLLCSLNLSVCVCWPQCLALPLSISLSLFRRSSSRSAHRHPFFPHLMLICLASFLPSWNEKMALSIGRRLVIPWLMIVLLFLFGCWQHLARITKFHYVFGYHFFFGYPLCCALLVGQTFGNLWPEYGNVIESSQTRHTRAE